MHSTRTWLTALTFVGGAMVLAGAAACNSVASVDLVYSEAGALSSASSDGGARRDGSPVVPADDGSVTDHGDIPLPGEGGAEDGGCTCDLTAGLGCCVLAAGAGVTCTAAQDCAAGSVWSGCQRYDPTTESYCCWSSAAGPLTISAFASTCAGKLHACVTSADCPAGTGGCRTRSCGNLTLGVCSATEDPAPCP